MTGSFLALLALGAVLASAAMTCLWLVQVRTRDANPVDVGWATGIAVLAVVYALLADGSAGHRVLAAALATVWGWLDPHPGLGPLEWTGAAVWAIGNAGAITADRQLARWRSNPENHGRTARTGLWAWSRHPNYFFESVTWCGVALVATAAPWGWVSWIVPAVLLFLLFRVTGIPATEAQALGNRADYADYQRTTSVFVPLPPRADHAQGHRPDRRFAS